MLAFLRGRSDKGAEKKNQSAIKLASERASVNDVILDSEGKRMTIRSLPSESDPYWTVFDGKRVRKLRTRQIVSVDAGRWLDGYGY